MPARCCCAFDEKEASGASRALLFSCSTSLNKYAPAQGDSPIKEIPLDAAEAQRAEYGFLSATHRQRATIAKPGTMFVSQPEIPVPLVVEFPFPAWASRPSERGGPPPNLDPVATTALPDDASEGIAAKS